MDVSIPYGLKGDKPRWNGVDDAVASSSSSFNEGTMKEVKEDARGESVVVPVSSSKGGDGMRGRGGWKMDVHDNDVMAQGRLNDATIKRRDNGGEVKRAAKARGRVGRRLISFFDVVAD